MWPLHIHTLSHAVVWSLLVHFIRPSGRQSVTRLVCANLLDPACDPAKLQLAVGTSPMLCFLNVAVDPSIILNQPESTKRLRRLLVELHTLLHTNGTLVIAMEGLDSCDKVYIRGEVGLLYRGDTMVH